ncbi:MAG: electron transfer flavoprotein beta subunit/FixA family protein [Gracilibacteraceae bacterium]|jgi:electron transfer flavoprotein beta subunit|nr:electron transfer flavoprotein beta subunit/FixA family protein [Gracilibacteraceae bacterium]
MKIIVCYKWTLDEADIRVDAATRAVLKERAKYRISPYDRNAVECGVRLAGKSGGEVVALSVGTAELGNSAKDILSRGVTRLAWLGCQELEDADAAGTARALAAAARKIGDYDLIVCGEGSSDSYSQQTGPRLAELLDIPVVTCASEISLDGSRLTVKRKLEEGFEITETTLPALITVLPDINEPRIPGLKEILGASKKPAERFSAEDLGLDPETLKPLARRDSLLGTATDRRRIVLKGEGAAAELLTILKQEGFC